MDLKFPELVISHTLSQPGDHPKYGMHTHTTAELFCFLSGKATYFVEGTEYPLSSGDILLMRPAEAHSVKTDPTGIYERLVIHFNTDLFLPLDPEGTLTRSLFQRKPGTRNLYRSSDLGGQQLALLQHMIDSGDRLTILADMILLLQQLGKAFDVETSRPPETLEYRILQHINSHLDQDLSVQELCDRFYISRAQLYRLFQKITGTTVGKYIATKRMILARQQILKGNNPSAIYTACGYKDYSTFYRSYCRYFGHNPRLDTGLGASPILEDDRIEFA